MELDGVITFFASHHAMRAEHVLKAASVSVRLIPGPRELSPSCGVALRFPYGQVEAVTEILTKANVQIEKVCFLAEAKSAPSGWRRLLGLKSSDGGGQS